jgi:hypothetical protein
VPVYVNRRQDGSTARESEVLRAATVIKSEAELAWELFLLHAVREPLAPRTKLGVRTADDAVARALNQSQ